VFALSTLGTVDIQYMCILQSEMSKKRGAVLTTSTTAVCSSQQTSEFRCQSAINACRPGIEGKPPVFWPQLIRDTEFSSIKIRSKKKPSRSAKRIKGYWQSAKDIYAIRYKSLDRRPYAEVRLLDRVGIGLLDTGASISAIGGKLVEQM